MNAISRLCRALLVIGAGLTGSTLAMVAAFAAVVFPMMKSLSPSLPDYSAYSGPHWMLVGASWRPGCSRSGSRLLLSGSPCAWRPSSD
ncbi:MAG: hypothetical protein IPJ41_13815 [Phycisphaerales bacterium]|nr:hypothetical protein [Phycisphaerales bacterium]